MKRLGYSLMPTSEQWLQLDRLRTLEFTRPWDPLGFFSIRQFGRLQSWCGVWRREQDPL